MRKTTILTLDVLSWPSVFRQFQTLFSKFFAVSVQLFMCRLWVAFLKFFEGWKFDF